MNVDERRRLIRGWMDVALKAVDPRRLANDALSDDDGEPVTVIAIGKAASAMCWGAHDSLKHVSGICVSNRADRLPDGFELRVGDHPVPGKASLDAGQRVLEVARAASGRCIAMISGGGSALCESPLPGIELSFLRMVNRVLLDAGAPIDEMNLIRRHLSEVKCGGVASATSARLETYVLSDVAGGQAHLVASGPTIAAPAQPDHAEKVMRRYGIGIDESVRVAMRQACREVSQTALVTVLADGRTAGMAIVEEAHALGIDGVLTEAWIDGDLQPQLASFLEGAGPGVTVAVGEPSLRVTGPGTGGRNTHAALIASKFISGSGDVFASFATDGIDGRSTAAGAIVDGATVGRGGDLTRALAEFDSGPYLGDTGDLIKTGSTGTNVADIWILWRD